MKKRGKRFRFSKKILECLAVIMLLGVTTFAASGGPGGAATYSTGESTSAGVATYSTKDGKWVQVDENTWTMDKDEDGKIDVTLVKKGDQWEYLFQVADPNAQYYGWEENVPDGYQIVGKGDRKNPIINKQDDFSITNEEKTEEKQEYGSLKLSKVVAGDDADHSQNFRFGITLTSDDDTLSNKLKGNTTFGNVNFKDGKATVYLKDKESIELRNIPVGITWKIQEDAAEGYETTISGGTATGETNAVTGVIEKNQTADIIYTNTKINANPGGGETPEDPTGSFKVKKVVKNGDKDDQFDFSAALTGLKAQKDYTVKITEADSKTKNITVTSNAAGTAYVEFKLKADETAEFVNLPIGSNYQIKEEANDYTASYEITDEDGAANLNAVMSQNENYESKKELATQKETLDANEKAVITFTNSKPAPKENTVDIEVEKIWDDNDNSAKLRPSEIKVHLYQSTSKDDEGDMIATAKLDESGEWKTTFKEMDKYPTNSTTPYIYTVKEDPVSGYKSEIKGADINTGKKYTITNTLSTVATGDLMLSKTVAGDGADTKKEFRFELTMKTKDDEALQGSFSLDKGKGTKTGTVYFDEDGKATISLKHGESAYITGLPEGAKFNVKETAYEDWTSSLLENTKWNGTIQENQVSKIIVKNTYEAKRQLTVEKTVTGSMGSKTKQFQFQLKLTAPTGQVLPTELEYTKGDETKMMQLKNDVYEFTLAHEETIVIKGIPSQSTYTVTEVDGESNGYTVTQTNATGTIKADTTVSFVNTKNGSVPTLADMNTKIPFVLVILAIGGVGFILWKKRKETR